MVSNFFEKVYDITRKIPYGKVTSYGSIAKHTGSAKSARMVGWALNKSELQNPPVPAHRVVNRNGLLTGKNNFANMNTMQELLESEGVKVANNRVIDFEKHFWNPE
ncbi:MAG: MGMT family protein [Bacteroidales bacterium]|nr:MGMT family protein [Bacteroidales bacterium]